MSMPDSMRPKGRIAIEARAKEGVALSNGSAHAAVEVPTVLRCVRLIVWVKILLMTRGLVGAASWIRARTASVPQASDPDIVTVTQVERAVAMAGAMYPGRAKCLEQSLVLYYLLRSQGVGVNCRLGVQPFPFQAHAWIEYRGEVVNDVPEHARQFTPLASLLP